MVKNKLTLQWPVPASFSKVLPVSGEPGCFWENRGDRFHCGIDIYAPFGSPVCAVADGTVVKVELFTSPDFIAYWNTTVAITIKHDTDLFVRYAEMQDSLLTVGQRVRCGDIVGHVGQVLELSRITDQAPLYIQKLKQNDNPTMLHLEMFCTFPNEILSYLGGNTFQDQQPDFLLNPRDYFK